MNELVYYTQNMLKKFVALLGIVMMSAGLLGFFIPNLFYLVQFDLFQSFSYALLGAVGLKLGFGSSADLHRLRYLKAVAIVNLSLLMLGLSWPNLGDLFHLEVPEHFWHGTVGVVSALAADFFRKQIVTQ